MVPALFELEVEVCLPGVRAGGDDRLLDHLDVSLVIRHHRGHITQHTSPVLGDDREGVHIGIADHDLPLPGIRRLSDSLMNGKNSVIFALNDRFWSHKGYRFSVRRGSAPSLAARAPARRPRGMLR